MSIAQKNHHAITRLTALWAFSEAGLGGIMHALKIPLTGFFVGGFAVIIIALISNYSGRNFRTILQSTLLVILVKAAVSPQSPVPAYFAVAFQGLSGAIIFYSISNFRVASLLFGFLALTESALQKFLFLTILFGKSVWEALDIFIQGIFTDFHIPVNISFSFWIIVIFTGVHALWGLVLGFWSSRLPLQLENKSATILKRFHLMEQSNEVDISKSQSKNKWLQVVLILIFIVMVYYSEGYLINSLYVIFRTIAIMLLLFVLLKPLLRWIFKKLEGKNKLQVEEVMNQLPEIKNLVIPAYRLASESYKGISRYKEFVLILIVFVLNDIEIKKAM